MWDSDTVRESNLTIKPLKDVNFLQKVCMSLDNFKHKLQNKKPTDKWLALCFDEDLN